MVTVRGLPCDEETQVGFSGSDQEVSQQLHEAAEGYATSQRWLSGEPRTLKIQFQTLDKNNNGKNTLRNLACHTKTGEAKQNFGLCMLAIKPQYEECSLITSNIE